MQLIASYSGEKSVHENRRIGKEWHFFLYHPALENVTSLVVVSVVPVRNSTKLALTSSRPVEGNFAFRGNEHCSE